MDTFERKETKYLLTPMQYIQFRALAEGRLAPAEYHVSDVTSIYYDTPDDTLINRSIAGGKYKEKLRVRSYGSGTAPDAPVFIEIKKKFKGITYKRRVCCTQAAAEAFLGGMDYERAIDAWPLADARAQANAHSRMSQQIAGEIAWMRDHYEGLAPKMVVHTHRLSFVAANDPELRITFDVNACWQQVGAEAPFYNLFANDERILEVKCAQAYPMWLVAVLNECGARPQSVSKYGRAYQAAMGAVQREAHAAATWRYTEQVSTAPALAPQPVAQERTQGIAAFIQSGLRACKASALSAFGLVGARKPAHAGQR